MLFRTSKQPNRFGAEDGIRTRDLNLGKVALYQLSYFREGWDCSWGGLSSPRSA